MADIQMEILELEKLKADYDHRAEEARKKAGSVTFDRFSCSMMAKSKLDEIQKYQQEEEEALKESLAIAEKISQIAKKQ